VKFLELLRKVYVNIPFLNALEEAPSYLRFLKELSKKGKLEEVTTVPIGEIYCSIEQFTI